MERCLRCHCPPGWISDAKAFKVDDPIALHYAQRQARDAQFLHLGFNVSVNGSEVWCR
jgi:hypothetical protein